MSDLSIRLVSVVGFACVAVVSSAVVGQSQSATAQSDNCYMVTSSGRVVGLDKLCGIDSSASPGKTTSAPPKNFGNVYRAAIKYRLGKTPVIDVTFNGKKSFEMIVDTGADGTLITREMAQALKLPVVGLGQFEMADGRVVNMPLARVQSISVNGAEVRNVEVAIASKNNIGLLGHDFFDNYDIKIKQNVVEFYKR